MDRPCMQCSPVCIRATRHGVVEVVKVADFHFDFRFLKCYNQFPKKIEDESEVDYGEGN